MLKAFATVCMVALIESEVFCFNPLLQGSFMTKCTDEKYNETHKKS